MYSFYCNLSLLFDDEKFHNLQLAEYFWPASSIMGIHEVLDNYAFFYGKPEKHSVLASSVKFMVESVLLCCKYLLLKYRRAANRKKIIGEVASDTDVIIVSWLFKDNTDAFIKGVDERYWKNLKNDLSGLGYNAQFLLFPMFKLNEHELTRLLAAGIILINSIGFFTLSRTFISLFHGIKKTAEILKITHRVSQLFFFLGSIMKPRLSRAINIKGKMLNVFRKNNSVKKIYIPWESQPEQKAITWAAKANHIKVIGYIHSGMNDSLYAFIPKKIEVLWKPNQLLVHGSDFIEMLEYAGWDRQDISLIRSVRYPKIPTPQYFQGKLFLPYDVEKSLKYIDLASDLISSNAIKVSEIKIHPANEGNLRIRSRIKSIKKDDQAKDVVVCGFSAVILEALESGVQVLQMLDSPDSLEKIDSFCYSSIYQKRVNRNLVQLSMLDENRGNLIDRLNDRTILDSVGTRQV